MSVATPQPRMPELEIDHSPRDESSITLDASQLGVTAVNQFLQQDAVKRRITKISIEHPGGMHNLAVGLDALLDVHIHGHAGYYAGGMNKHANITVHGNVERGVAENMMSGTVRILGNASESAAASAHGGVLIIHGDAAGRCGISLKGADIVVGGSVGHAAMFMAQAGRLLICGNAGPGLGDSIYEAVIYVGGTIEGLGADAREEPMTAADHTAIAQMLATAGLDPTCTAKSNFKRVASARTLYHWNSEHHSSY